MRAEMPSHLESYLDAFDAAWQEPEPPQLEEFLPLQSEADRLAVLVGLVRIDLERRIKRGESARIESYVARFPELCDGVLAGLVLLEYRLRRGHDPAFDAAEYPARFPEFASQLHSEIQTVIAGAAGAAAGKNGIADLDLRDCVLLDTIGSGGMGVVYRGRDPALERSLAVKVLRPELCGHAEAERRFRQEARINGLLQHPSIVPVHNLGRLPDGRLYFTMKLIRGRTLSDVLAAEQDGTGRRQELLGIFEKVCQAVAYAHSRKVIHRDLKPQNVMVGAFGEVQVMDWGLAKVLPRPSREPTAESTLGVMFHTKRPDSTADGVEPTGVVGTPAYMAPEQARGQAEEIDERTDVFGLGGILCAIVTGQSPYTGERRDEVLGKAAAGNLAEAEAHLSNCGADAELVMLCRNCLAAGREDRPRDAGVVAERVAAYLAAVQDRLRKAELERAAAEARAEEEAKTRQAAEGKAAAERRSRRLAVCLATAAVVMLLLGGTAAWWFDRQQTALRQDVEKDIDEVARLQAKAQWAEARTALVRAEARLGAGGPEDLRRRLKQMDNELDLVVQLDAIRLERATLIHTRETAYARADQAYTALFAEVGLGVLGDDIEAVADRVRDSGVREALIAALDDWATCAEEAQRSWLLGVSRRSDPDAWRDRARSLAMWRDPAALRGLAAEEAVAVQSPHLVASLAGRLMSVKEDATELLRRALERHPNDFWLNLGLGNALARSNPGEALGYYRVALALRPGTVAVLNNLGIVLGDQGRLDEAQAVFRKAIALDSKATYTHNNLGNILCRQGRLDDAQTEYRKAIALQPTDPGSHHGLGNILCRRGELNEAQAEYRKAIDLDSTLVAPHYGLATALHQQGQLEEAQAEYCKAIALDPKVASPHIGLGNILYQQNRLEEAKAAYHKAIALDPRNAKPHHSLGKVLTTALDPELTQAHLGLGNILYQQNRLEEAKAAYGKAIALDPKDAKSHYNLGNVLYQQGLLEEAQAAYREAIALDANFAHPHHGLGNILCILGRLEEAKAAYRNAIARDPKDPSPHTRLGVILQGQGRLEDAKAAYRKAIALDPKDAKSHYNLGNISRDEGRPEEAEGEYLKAIALDAKFVPPHNDLGNVLSQQGRLEEAKAAYREAIALDPRNAMPHNGLANALFRQDRLEESQAAYRRAIVLDAKFAHPHHGLGNILRTQGRLKEARGEYNKALALGLMDAVEALQKCDRLLALAERLPAVLKGEETPTRALEWIEFANLCMPPFEKRYAAAACLYAEAFAADANLASDPRTGNRYNAACGAVLAAAGLGEDAKRLADKETLGFRRQALAWLRADLSACATLAGPKDLKVKEFVRQNLAHWQQDSDLASVRDKAALDKLPEDERARWRQLWEGVDRLLRRVNGSK